MKKIAAVLALVALAGCSKTVYVTETTEPESADTSVTEAPETTVRRVTTTRPPVTTSPSLSDEELFISAVHYNTDMTIYLSDYELLEAGYLVCGSLDSGISPSVVAETLFQSSYEYGEGMMQMMAAIGAGATTFLCPWNSNAWATL